MMKSYATRIFSLILALVLSISLCVPAFAASGFSDVPTNYWAYDNIVTCAELGIVAGYEDGTFRPEDSVTYAQLIVMIGRTFYGGEVQQVTDTAGNPWYYPYMQVAREHDLDFKTNIVNYGGWPVVAVADTAINRYEMASILRLVLMDHGKSPKYEEWQSVIGSITDYDQIPAGDDTQIYYLSVPSCYYAGVLTGMSDGAFHGEQGMTRAQACAVIIRMMNLLNGSIPAAPSTPTTPAQPEQPEETGTGKLANGKDITSANVMEILAQIQREYPSGTIWGKSGTANNNSYAAGNSSTDVKAALNKYKNTSGSNGLNTVTACGGWAAMVSDRIFGQSGFPAREVTDASKVRAGDIIIALNANGQIVHVGIASCDAREISGAYRFTTCNGNDNSSGVGQVSWDSGNTTLTATRKAYTRYPN